MSEIFAKLYIANVSALEDEELFSKAYSVVPKVRQDKIDKLKFMSDKCMSLGAGLLLKEFDLDGGYHSISHSGGYAMVLIASSKCGCDIERIRENTDIKKLSNRFFENETASLDEFFTLWTRKESLFKASGIYITEPLDYENYFYRTFDIIEGFKISTCLAEDIDLSIENITISSIIK